MVKQDYFQIFLLKCTTLRCSDGCYCPQTPNKGEREDQREPSEYTGFSDKEIYAEKYLLNTTQTTMPSGAFHSWVSSTLSQPRNLLHLIEKKKNSKIEEMEYTCGNWLPFCCWSINLQWYNKNRGFNRDLEIQDTALFQTLWYPRVQLFAEF